MPNMSCSAPSYICLCEKKNPFPLNLKRRLIIFTKKRTHAHLHTTTTHHNLTHHTKTTHKSSSAASAAAIYGSEEDKQETVMLREVSGIDDNMSDYNNDTNSSNNNGETEQDLFFQDTRDIMNRTSQKVGTADIKDRQFHSIFEARIEIALMVWDMLGEGSLHPDKSRPKHLLWTLYFLKVYPREGPGCSAVSGSKGAIDPETMRKWVWLFLERISELADD
jgi:hypothetical protein